MNELQTVVLSGVGVIQPENGARRLENFALENYLESQKTYLDRCSALALAGAALALRDAEIEWPIEGGAEFGIALGTHLGCIETMQGFWKNVAEKGVRLATPLLFSHSYVNSPISLCAIEFGLKGYHSTFCAGKNSGLEAVRGAFDAIRLGHAQAMLCGGVEALTPTRQACESGDLGEASVFFVLESIEHAAARGIENAREISEAVFEDAARDDSFLARFGDCGGATSALKLAEIFNRTFARDKI